MLNLKALFTKQQKYWSSCKSPRRIRRKRTLLTIWDSRAEQEASRAFELLIQAFDAN